MTASEFAATAEGAELSRRCREGEIRGHIDQCEPDDTPVDTYEDVRLAHTGEMQIHLRTPDGWLHVRPGEPQDWMFAE